MSPSANTSHPLYACIVGYGAARDPVSDGNTSRYLSEALKVLGQHTTRIQDILLCGGYTNRHDLSEAAAMLLWIKAHHPAWADKCLTLETPLTLEDDLREAASEIPTGAEAFIFCEQSRIWSVRFHARRLFKDIGWRVIGIAFDAPSLKPTHRLKQLLVHLPIEVLSTKSRFIAGFKHRQRTRKIAEARAAFNRDR